MDGANFEEKKKSVLVPDCKDINNWLRYNRSSLLQDLIYNAPCPVSSHTKSVSRPGPAFRETNEVSWGFRKGGVETGERDAWGEVCMDVTPVNERKGYGYE